MKKIGETIIFENQKEQIKAAIMEEAKNFCDMIDCVDEPPGLKYQVSKFGVNVTIEATLQENSINKCCKGGSQWGHSWDCHTLP